jgi:hypothetical protein
MTELHTVNLYDIEYYTFHGKYQEITAAILHEDTLPGGIPPAKIARIVEQLERRKYLGHILALVATASFQRAPFRTSVTRAFARTCLQPNSGLHGTFLDVLVRKSATASEVMYAIRGENCFFGFSLAELPLMERWVALGRWPLPIRWNARDVDPNTAAPDVRSRFVALMTAALAAPAIRVRAEHYRFFNNFMHRMPLPWIVYLYRHLPVELQAVLRGEYVIIGHWRRVQEAIDEAERIAPSFIHVSASQPASPPAASR